MNNTQPRRHHYFALVISLLISGGTIALLFRNVDFGELLDQLRQADAFYLLLMVAFYPVSMVVRALRWRRLLKTPLNFWRGFHILNVGFFFNAVLPFRLGELTRVLLMSREPNQGAGPGLSALTVERLFDLTMALLCVGAGLALVPESAALSRETRSTLGGLILITVIGMVVILALPRSHPLLMKAVRWVVKPLPHRWRERLVKFAEETLSSLAVVSTPRRLLTIALWSALTWACYVSFFFIGLYGFFDAPPFSVGLLVTGFVAIGIAAPSLPGAIGVFQAAGVLALNTAGYDTTIATSYAWTIWLAQTGLVILGGVWGLWAMSLSFTQLSHEVQEMEIRPH